MAFGTSSRLFRAWPLAVMGQGQTAAVLPAGYAGLGADTVKGALFGNSVTPDPDAALTATGFNTGTWTTGNEVTDATNWVSGGRALASKTLTNPATGVFMFDAADLAGGGTVTLTNVYGIFHYDDTLTVGTGGIADQGICYNYLGGPQSVSAGTFTVVYNASGVFRITV